MAMAGRVAREKPGFDVPNVHQAGLKAFAALVKHLGLKDGASLTPARAAALAAPVTKLGALLGEMQSLELFADLFPPAGDPIVELTHGGAEDKSITAFASSKESAAAAPLTSSGDGWTSSSGKSAHWGVRFATPQRLSSLRVEFKESLLPETVVIEADTGSGKDKEDFVAVNGAKGEEVRKAPIAYTFARDAAAGDTLVRAIRLQLNGTNAKNAESSVSITRVRLWIRKPRAPASAAGDALQQLATWLHGVASAAAAASTAAAPSPLLDDAAATLCQLARASGSLRVVLGLAQALLAAPQRSLSPAAAAAGVALLNALRSHAGAERVRQSRREYRVLPGLTGSGAGGGAAIGIIPGAQFDKGAKTSELHVSDDGMRADTLSVYSNGYCAVNVGPFTEGKAAWTFKLVEDTHSPCSCFGAVTQPVENHQYDSSPEMLMVRAYNGYCYEWGTTNRCDEKFKIRPQDEVRFDLDFDEGDGVMYITINGDKKGICFSNLRGRSLWPAVAFYSSGRAIQLISVEADLAKFGPRKSGAAAPGSAAGVHPLTGSSLGAYGSTFLSDLAEHHAVVGRGVLGKNGILGFDPSKKKADDSDSGSDYDSDRERSRRRRAAKKEDSTKVKVGGSEIKHSLAMHPPSLAPKKADGEGEGDDEDVAVVVESGSADAAASASAGAAAAEGGAGAASGAGAVAAEPSAASASAAAAADASPEARKERLLAAAHAATTSTFKGCASAVFWLGKGYETLTGSTALADSATAAARNADDAAPVFFEVYGDGRLLWRSAPVMEARSPSQPFSVRVLGVEVLRLVTRVAAGGGANGAHAVWVDPLLSTTTEWCAYGWRNDRSAMTDALTGVPRGADLPLPSPLALGLVAPADRAATEAQATAAAPAPATSAAAVAGSSWPAPSAAWLSTAHGLAAGLLRYAGLLAGEHLRGMRLSTPPAGDTAGAELDAPFALQPCEGAVADIASLVSMLAEGRYSATGAAAPLSLAPAAAPAASGLDTAAQADAAASLIRLLTANLRRVAAVGVHPAIVGLASQKDSEEGAAAAAGAGAGKDKKKDKKDKKEDKDKDKEKTAGAAALFEVAKVVAGVVGQLYKAAAWGGAAAGRKLADGPAGSGAGGASGAAAAAAAAASPAAAVLSSPAVQNAVWELLELGSGLVHSRELRSQMVRAVTSGAGTVELQLNWPCDDVDAEGALVQLETVLLRVQLFASQAGLRTRLFGRWPAKVFLVVDIPGNGAAGAGAGAGDDEEGAASASGSGSGPASVRAFLEETLAGILESVDLPAPGAPSPSTVAAAVLGPEAEPLPVRIERRADWERGARLAVEPGIGSIRVYPAFAASFDDVTAALEAFLPADGDALPAAL